MVWQIKNVPTAASGVGIECIQAENGDYLVQTADGWKICTICGTTPASIASGIALMAMLIRDRGFEQGRKHVRHALGIDGFQENR